MAFLALPRIDPEIVRAERNPRYLWRLHVPFVVIAGAALWLPLVRRATGVDPFPVALAWLAHLVLYGWEVHAGAGERHPRLFALLGATTNAIASALPAATTGRSLSPLWLVYFVYPMIAAYAMGWNAVVLAIFVLTPALVAFGPWAAAGEVPPGEAALGALILAASAGVAYGMLAAIGELTRAQHRREREADRAAAAEAERRRVAHELHATLGAALSEVALWQDVAAGAGQARAAEAVGRARARTREALEELRTTVQGLGGGAVAPEALEGRLRRRLSGLCDAAGIALSLSVDGAAPVPAIRAYHLQKLVEEAVLNAIRHARARRVDVAVELAPLGASVRDDGCGFDAAAAPAGHGLAALAAHAQALGARLDLRSAPGGGTEVRLAAGGPDGLA